MKLLGQKVCIEFSDEKQALLISSPEGRKDGDPPLEIDMETLRGMDFVQAAEFVGDRILLSIPEMRELFRKYLFEEFLGVSPEIKDGSNLILKANIPDSGVSTKNIRAYSGEANEGVVCKSILGIRPDGEKIEIKVKIGVPLPGDDNTWVCAISLEPLYSRLADIAGCDALHSLCLAISLVLDLLKAFRDKGGRLVHEDGTDVTLDAYAFGFALNKGQKNS